ncbi:MlaD family protein [Nocardia sp. NPDC005366]|uniref:MlaD family protein n=1 Tax=Nocardia sp. NPDC005366 TaxID=3156878 RepID=UPI0033B06296
MKTPRQAALRLSLLAAVVVAIIVLVVQAIERPVGGETVAYRAQFGDVFGLQQNADVRLRGVQVGKVTAIELTGDGHALVRFTLLTEYRLREVDRIAVKFQNLTGQRYLALERGATSGMEVASDTVFTNTVDSFDITTVFNGLRPLLREADPAVYNQLATNVAAMIDGSEASMTPVLRDIATLASYADNRTELMTTILGNLQSLSDKLRGRSENLENILRVFHSIFMPIASRMGEFLVLMDKGSLEMTEVTRTADALARLFLGAENVSDDLTRRIGEVIPDSATAVRTLTLLPGLLEGLNKLIPSTDPARQCSNGTVALPITAEVLISGRQLTICNGSR